MLYTVYRTTHLDSGKFYIGVHKTTNPNDTYLGSGSHIINAIKRYGRQRFVKSILFIFPTLQEALDKEKELVSEVLGSDNCMNVCEGGGLVDLPAAIKGGTSAGKIHRDKMNSDDCYKSTVLARLKSAVQTNWDDEGYSSMMREKLDWTGKSHKDSTKKLMSEKARNSSRGEKNSQYGTRWVTDGSKNLKCKNEDVELYLQSGWRLGRVL